jgi:hypothetical protein
MNYIGNMIPCAAALAVLLVISGLEQNPGHAVEAENIVQVLCSGRESGGETGNRSATNHGFETEEQGAGEQL